MSHLDYIRIRGLEASDTECFQGIGGGAIVAPGTTTSAPSLIDLLNFDLGELPEETQYQVSQYFQGVSDYLDAQSNPSRGPIAVFLPKVPMIIGALQKWKLPPMIIAMLMQAAMSLVDAVIREVTKIIAPTPVDDLVQVLQKALLFGDDESVLKKALLTDEQTSILNERLSDLAYVDQTVDFGPFQIHIRGKMITY